jgi:hypothetical protein
VRTVSTHFLVWSKFYHWQVGSQITLCKFSHVPSWRSPNPLRLRQPEIPNPTATLFPLSSVRTVGCWQLACGGIKRGAKLQGLWNRATLPLRQMQTGAEEDRRAMDGLVLCCALAPLQGTSRVLLNAPSWRASQAVGVHWLAGIRREQPPACAAEVAMSNQGQSVELTGLWVIRIMELREWEVVHLAHIKFGSS